MEEVNDSPVDSATSEEEDSTEGNQQEAGNLDADASDIDAPAEDDAAPVEEPSDNSDEAEESDSTELGMEIMVDDNPAEQTITYKVMKGETEASTAADVKFDPTTVTKDGDKVTVKAETAIKFTVELAEEIVAAEPLVTAKDGETAIAASNITSSETNGVYTVTIANGAGDAALTGNVEITIHVADKTYEVNAPTTGNDKGITWKIKKSTDEEYDAESSSKVTVTKADSVTVQATLAKGKESVEVTLNGETKTLAKVDADAEEDASTAEFTVKAADLELALTVTLTADYVVKKEVIYTVVADEGATVSIEDAKGTAVTPGTGDDAGKYKLTSNETYLIKIEEITKTEDLEMLQSITVGTTPAKYNSVKKGFEFTAKEEGGTITVSLVAETTSFGVTLVMDKNAVVAATVQADEYKNGSADDANQEADENPVAIGESKTYTNVWKGTDFSFALAATDAEFYEVTKVETSTDGKTWTTLTEEGGKYTIKAISADTQVQVSTDFKEGKAYSIKFTADDDVASVTADVTGTGAESPTETVEVGETYRFKAATGAKVTFKVTTKTGYKVDKLSYGSGENDTIVVNTTDTDETVYEYNKFAADNKTATINISTKADALTEDKFVKFNVGDGVTLKVNGVESEKKDGVDTGVYKLTKKVDEVKDAEGKVTTPAVAEISELKFDLTVPYGSYLNKSFAEGDNAEKVRATTDKRVKSEDGKTWTYSYKVVANRIDDSATSLANPYEIEIPAADAEHVTLNLTEASEPVKYKVLDISYAYANLSSGTTVDANETVILQAKKGQSLKVNGEAVELDDSYRYRFDTKLNEEIEEENGTVYKIEAKSAAAYKLLYTIDAGEEQIAGEEPVEVEYGKEVALQLVEANDSTPVAISKKEVTENAKSEVTLANQTANKGEAVIKVKDSNVTLTLYTIETKTVGTIEVETEVEAARITLTSKDASGKILTVKGITKGKSVKLDATSVTNYALTLKEGSKTLNAADYDSALKVSCDKTKVKAEIEGGKLIVKPLTEGETEVKILAAADDSDSALFDFKVNAQAPALKVKSVTSVNQGMHDILVDVAADASIKTISDQFDLYYEVEVKKTDGASTLNKEGFYYLAADPDAKDKIAPVSQLFTVNTETDNEKMENTYTFTVRLVAVTAGTTVNEGDPTGKGSNTIGTKLADTDVKFATAADKDKKVGTFKTRKGYYEDKLSVTKKTTKLYSGQDDILVAIPKFSKNASHIEDISAVVYNKDGSQNDSVSAEVNSETLGVYISAGAYTAGSYDVVIYATATKDGSDYDMYRASAKVPITVQKGIDWVQVDSPTQVAVLGKDASVTLKATGWYALNDDRDYVKAQTQKFLYELDTTSISNPKNKDKVIVKNNKVTVKKDFSVGADPDDNTFAVNVIANDYGSKEDNLANDRYKSVEITVTNEALVIGSVKLVDSSTNKELGDTITTEQIMNACVVLTDAKGKTIAPDLVTLTPNKGKIRVHSSGYVYVTGYQKNLTVKAVTKDGGKKSASSKKYTITYPEGISYDIKCWGDEDLETLSKLDSGAVLNKTGNTYTYLGRGNDTIRFYVTATTGSGVEAYERLASTSSFNYSVKVTGGKITSDKGSQAFGFYAITPTAKDVKVTITDKTKQTPNTTEFTFTDNGWTTTAAPTASTKDKLYAARKAANDDYIPQNLTYAVKWKNNVSYPYVKLDYVSGVWISEAEGEKTITDNSFTLQGITSIGNTGTAKYSVVYGDYDEDDVFIPKTKAATLSIKINKAANPKAVAKYTINPKVSMSAQLEAKPVLAGYESRVKFTGVLSANNKGNKNRFYDYFEVVGDKLQIKSAKWAQEELDKLDKTDLTGYLEYEYYDVTTERKVKKQDKITVVISDKTAPKYTATNIDIVAVDRATAATTIKLGGTAVPIAKVATDSDAWEAALPTPAANTTGVVNLTAKAIPASGNVDLYVIPADSQNGSGAALTAADPKTAGIKVTVKVTTKAADDNKTKITIARGAKTPVASIDKTPAPAKVNLTVELKAGRDFTYNLSNATIAANGVAKTDAAQITDAAKKKAAEAVNSVSYTDETITIVLDRDKLDGNKQYNVPVDLTFTAGAKETVYFPVKTEKIPTKDDIKKLVESELKDFAVAKASYNNATAAAAAVKETADAIEIPALSGIEVTAVAAKDPATFADNGDKKGDHTIKITLTDVTKAADATDKTVDVLITVTEKATKPTVGDALKEAIEKYAIPGNDGKVPEGKIAVTKALAEGDTLQTALQKAVDGVEPYKYNVKVTDIVVATTTVAAGGQNEVTADEAAAEKVTNLTFNYQVRKATTGQPMETKDSYAVNLTNGTIETPAITSNVPVTPDPGTETKEVASIAITASNSSITQGTEGTVTFTATLKASDGSVITDADKVASITWSVTRDSGETDEGTAIVAESGNNAKATLTVAAAEEAGTLNVTASIASMKSNEVRVTVAEADDSSE